jgi:two-component system KDP operon response regulator KdpE
VTEPVGDGPASTRILHVEDEELNRRLLRAVLERAADSRLRSAVIDEAPDIESARRFLSSNVPDLVVLDVRLPDGNGLVFMGEIRSSHPSARVVVMSASVLASERAEAMRAGCDAFVGKPYSAGELTEVLGRVLSEGGAHIQPI